MVVKLRKTKIYKKEIIFLLSYICFFSSLFLSDVGIASELDKLTKSLRYISYLLAFIRKRKIASTCSKSSDVR